jgi:hypothetical protein
MTAILDPGAPQRQSLDAIQAKEAEVRKAILAAERAPRAPDDVRKAVRATIEQGVAASNGARVGGYVADGLRAFARPGRGTLPDLSESRNLWAALFLLVGPQAAEDRIVALATEGAAFGLQVAKREQRIAELRAEWQRLEVDEEREILKLESAGFGILRRADVDPAVCLAIWQRQRDEPHHQHDDNVPEPQRSSRNTRAHQGLRRDYDPFLRPLLGRIPVPRTRGAALCAAV